MPIIDDRTLRLNLPLPHADNQLQDDVGRLRSALTLLDAGAADKADLIDGKVPAAQLPSYVDDVLELGDLSAFPETGESGKIYIAIDTGKTYRWGGSAYAVISDYTLPAATASTKGGVRVGSGLSIGFDGQLSVIGGTGSGGVPSFNELLMTPSANGQTVFNPAGGYGVGMIEVSINGIEQYGNGEDYIANDGVKITLLDPVNTTDRVLLRRWITSNNFPFSALTDKPSTLAGYGITDAMPKAGGTFTGAVYYSAGINFGSTVGTTPQNFSNHIALYGNTYGLSITGSSLNYVADVTASHNFFAGAANVANLSSAGKLTVLGGVTARKGLCLVGSSPSMTADNYAAGRSIQVNTDTAAFGGPHDDHSCFAIHPYMGAGWTSGEMRILIANGAGSYNYGSPALIVGENGITHKGNVTAYSDRKLKDNIETIGDALAKVKAMRGVYYTLKADPSKRRQVGVIAQEMQEVLPEVVSSVKSDTKSDEETLVVAYANTIAVLIEAVKELSTEVAALKARVA